MMHGFNSNKLFDQIDVSNVFRILDTLIYMNKIGTHTHTQVLYNFAAKKKKFFAKKQIRAL